jgi:hypothetical protein
MLTCYTMSETPPPLPPGGSATAGQSRWGNAFVLMLIVALVAETYFSMTVVPRFARTFEEMLGTMDKLPTAARSVVAVSRFQQNWIMPLALPGAVLFGLLWWQRRKLWAKAVCGVLALGLVIYSVVGFVGLQMPALQLIQSIGEPIPASRP